MNHQSIEKLAERLSRLSIITENNNDKNKEEWTIAYSFADLEESFTKFLEDFLPKIQQAKLSDEELKNILLDIGEEFRHILYHINSMEYYNYLRETETHQ